jgi:hypothetical protein
MSSDDGASISPPSASIGEAEKHRRGVPGPTHGANALLGRPLFD